MFKQISIWFKQKYPKDHFLQEEMKKIKYLYAHRKICLFPTQDEWNIQCGCQMFPLKEYFLNLNMGDTNKYYEFQNLINKNYVELRLSIPFEEFSQQVSHSFWHYFGA